ncbi:ATP-binding protein [Streptomyces sp. TLI_105]|uniref:ATP-binding protein n=1 Tax=Streptomyces sp. TLI_105 TaxID=1881019 RepID=UPI000899E9F1|nr:ATP-binding protein [Streptomyces sp. TLI_105]SED88564.1 Histidine kinase-like ATPase domain-containing protein [Streptomyces sp. TLI_105]
MISEPSRYYAVELQALPPRIGQIRRIISAHLRHWQLDALVDQAVLGLTELLTNVHRHAQPDKGCKVEIELLLDRLTVSVRDHDPRLPEVRRSDALDASGALGPVDDLDALATSGRGLGIVGAVSESWGIRPCGADGKVVWFTLTAPALGDPVDECARAVYEAATEGLLAGVGYSRLPGMPLSSPAEPLPAPSVARPVLAGRAG